MEHPLINERLAQKELEKGYDKAEKLLNDKDQMEQFLQQLEKKLSEISGIGSTLKNVPILISLIKNYINKEYTTIPIGSIVAITSSLIYFLSPIDFIPDPIPGIGLVDDMFVILVCCKLVETDLKIYTDWRENR